VLLVGGDALEPANGYRLGFLGDFLHTAPPAGRLAGPVAGAPEHTGKDVGMPVDHIGVGITPRRDQPDIFRHRRVGWTGPLAIDDLVEVSGIADVGGLHSTGAKGCGPLRLADGCTTHTLTNSPNDLPRYETNV